MVRHLGIPPVEPHGRAVVRFDEVRHSTESFTVRIYLGHWSETDLEHESRQMQDMLAGTVGIYGHGDIYGSQTQLDERLASFRADVDLTPALARCSRPVGELTLTVEDAQGQRRPPELFRFSRADLVVPS